MRAEGYMTNPAALTEFLRILPPGLDAMALGQTLTAMVGEGLDALPLPGSGQTLERWRMLAQVAAQDLGLCKLYEGHTDALAIMAELGADAPPPRSTWGTWAAEPPQARVTLHGDAEQVRLRGRKAWCSGAAVVSHGLLTAWDDAGRQCLVAVDLNQPGVRITSDGWQAVGMAATASVDIFFDDAEARRIGPPAGYLERPGFWQGGAGIAACWYGGTEALAEYLRASASRRDDPHALAHLGRVDTLLQGARSALAACATWIDRHPREDAQWHTRRVRALVEECAETVQAAVGRALGAQPFCREAHFARLAADLPVYLRQSHGERDLAVLGERVRNESTGSWKL